MSGTKQGAIMTANLKDKAIRAS